MAKGKDDVRDLDEVYEEITDLFEDFKTDAEKQINKNNASAGRRARSAGTALGKLIKEFRKASLAY